MEERIMTLHPQKKQGVNISKAKYDQMRAEIERALLESGPLGFGELNDVVGEQLAGKFEGSIGWYYTTVKLDLEARGVIVCERKSGQAQMIRLA